MLTTHPTPVTRQHRIAATRVSPLLLALVVSLVAVLAAVLLHGVVGVAEVPLVVGTIVVASVIGWLNTGRLGRR